MYVQIFDGMMMWRDSGQPVKLGPIDGRATIFIFFALYSMSLKAIFLCFVGIIGLVVLERFGYTIPNALRRLNVVVMGRHRVAVTARRRSRIDR